METIGKLSFLCRVTLQNPIYKIDKPKKELKRRLLVGFGANSQTKHPRTGCLA